MEGCRLAEAGLIGTLYKTMSSFCWSWSHKNTTYKVKHQVLPGLWTFRGRMPVVLVLAGLLSLFNNPQKV